MLLTWPRIKSRELLAELIQLSPFFPSYQTHITHISLSLQQSSYCWHTLPFQGEDPVQKDCIINLYTDLVSPLKTQTNNNVYITTWEITLLQEGMMLPHGMRDFLPRVGNT